MKERGGEAGEYMKRMFALIFCMGLLGAGAGVVFCQDQAPSENTKTAVIEGDVTSVDWVGDKFVVRGSAGDMTFLLTDDTIIMKGTQTVPATELEEGAHVEVTFVPVKEGIPQALRISVTDSL